jgi:hypothetical protein
MLCYNLFFFQVHYKLFHQESSKQQGLHWFRKSGNIVTTRRCNHIQILDLWVSTHTHTHTQKQSAPPPQTIYLKYIHCVTLSNGEYIPSCMTCTRISNTKTQKQVACSVKKACTKRTNLVGKQSSSTRHLIVNK